MSEESSVDADESLVLDEQPFTSKPKPEDHEEVIIQDKILTFDEASKCLNTLGKDESCMRYAYLRFTGCDQKLTDIRTLLNFRHILFVDVSGNYLQTSALNAITGMPFLIQLHAQRNFVDSCGLQPMCYLQDLSLSRNRIHDTMNVIQPELEYLDLNYNQIYQIVLISDDVPNLKELELRGNFLFELGGTIPESLEKLYLAQNNISRLVSSDMANLKNLQVLHLRQNKIHKLNGFTANLVNLKYINLRENKITKIRQFRKLQCLPAFETLIFLENPVSGTSAIKSAVDDDDDDELNEELGEDRDVFDPNRVPILALLPNLKRINKTPVTFVEREQARLNKTKLVAEIMEIESSEDEDEPTIKTSDMENDRVITEVTEVNEDLD